MKHLFIPYEIAVIAKEKGFDEPCLKWYSSNGKLNNNVGDILSENQKSLYGCCAAPLYQQIIDWLREKHNIYIMHNIFGSRDQVLGFQWHVQKGMDHDTAPTSSKTYYNGLDMAIIYSLGIINQ